MSTLNKIQILHSNVTSAPSSLSFGELAYSQASQMLFVGNDVGTPVQIGGKVGQTVQPYDANTVIDSNYNHITVTSNSVSDGTNTFNKYTLSAATAAALGGVKLFSDTVQATAANAVSTTASRTYGIQVNSSGQAVVNVPWSDTNTTYSTATSSTNGLIKLGSDTAQTVASNAVTATASRSYALQLNASGQGVVNVPWTDTTYSTATSTTNGLVKLASDTVQTVAANTVTATASRTYGVQLTSGGQMVVNVPWVDTDTNTTYTAGTGLALSGTDFSLDFSELTDMTADISGTTEFILQNGTTESRKAANEIKLSNFVNDSGWTTNVGTITGVTAAAGLTGGGTSGSVSVSVGQGTGIIVNADDVAVNFTTSGGTNGTATTVARGDHTHNYLTAESDTLNSVTGRGATTTNGITVGGLTVNGSGSTTGDFTVGGNLYVTGEVNKVATTNLDVADLNITMANGSVNKASSDGAGIIIDLGTDGAASILYDATNDILVFNKSIDCGTF